MKLIIDGVSVDLPSSGNGGSSGGLSDIYSTEEVQIGYWVDKKPLYRKVITGTITEHNTYLVFPTNLDVPDTDITCVNIYGYIKGTNTARADFPVNSIANETAKASTFFGDTGLQGIYGTQFLNAPIVIIMEYTKTTDEPVTDIPTGGGGASSVKMVLITLLSSAWDVDKKQTVSVTGVKADESAQVIRPTPAIASQSAYYSTGILCVNQAENSLTFQANTIPTEDISVYVEIQEVK